MSILMEEQPKQPHPFELNILSVFQQLSFFPTTPASSISNIHLLGKIFLQRISRYINIIWTVSLKKRKIFIQLKINLNYCNFGSFLGQIFRKRRQQVCDFIFIINNLSLGQREGTIHLNEITGNISLKICIDFFSYSSTAFKKKTIIVTHIRKTISTYVQILERLIFYFKVPGYNLHELGNILQQQNSIPLKMVTQKIQMLRHLYDKNRWTEKIHEERNARAIVDFLHGSKMMMEEEFNVTHHKLNRIDQEFKSEKKLLQNNLKQFQQYKYDSILTAIDIKGKTQEHFIGKGGYGSITCAIYSYIPLLSIYDPNNTTKVIPDKQLVQQRKQMKTGCSLVKKVCLDIEQADLSQKNQCTFLTYMRGKVCPFFAKYFCNKSITPFSDGQIYLQYYPNSLDQTQLRLENKLKVMQDVCMGILFLSSEQILHRDLKEVNIMVDRNKRGRIIDFGSVAAFNSSQKFKPHDSKLRSTQDYYYSYRNLCMNFPNVARKYTKDQFYAHQKFDNFSFGKILFNQFSLSSIIDEGEFLRHQLNYLSLRCMEIDPELRWTIDQIIVFIRQLLIYNQTVRKFWKIGFDMSSSVHKIETAYPPKEFSNQQRIAELNNSGFKKQ